MAAGREMWPLRFILPCWRKCINFLQIGPHERSPLPLFLNLWGLKLSSGAPKHIPHQCVRGKAIKPALLFLSIPRISTSFSEIPPQSGANLKDFPLQMSPKRLLRSARILLVFCIYLPLKRQNLLFLPNQTEPRSPPHESRTSDCLQGGCLVHRCWLKLKERKRSHGCDLGKMSLGIESPPSRYNKQHNICFVAFKYQVRQLGWSHLLSKQVCDVNSAGNKAFSSLFGATRTLCPAFPSCLLFPFHPSGLFVPVTFFLPPGSLIHLSAWRTVLT